MKIVRLCSREVAEIAGVQHPQAVLVLGVELGPPDLPAKCAPLRRRDLVRRPAAILPLVDQAGEMLGRPALGVDVLGRQQLFDQPLLIVDVDDGVVRLQPDEFGVPPQDLGGDRVEGAQPAQAFGRRPDHVGDAGAHLPRRLVGEGDGQQLPRPGPPCGHQVRTAAWSAPASCLCRRPASTSTRALSRLHGAPLLGVQTVQRVGRADAGEGRKWKGQG